MLSLIVMFLRLSAYPLLAKVLSMVSLGRLQVFEAQSLDLRS
jgi:hypothetical protein